jgi:hypothetical protein
MAPSRKPPISQNDTNPDQEDIPPIDENLVNSLDSEIRKIGLKDPETKEFIVGRYASNALDALLQMFVNNPIEGFRVQITYLLLRERLVEDQLVPFLATAILPQDVQDIEKILSLIKGVMLPLELNKPFAREIYRLQRNLKGSFSSSKIMEKLLTIIVEVCLSNNERHSLLVDGNHRARIFTLILIILRNLFLLVDTPYYLKGRSESRNSARNIHLLKAMQKSKFIDFLIAITNEKDHPLIRGRKREIIGLWNAIFLHVNPSISDGEFVYFEEGAIKRPIRHGRFSGSVVVQLATGQEMMLQHTSQILNSDGLSHLEEKKKGSRTQPMLEYLPEYALLSKQEVDFYRSLMNLIPFKGIFKLS